MSLCLSAWVSCVLPSSELSGLSLLRVGHSAGPHLPPAPTIPSQGFGRHHPKKPGQSQKYVCKKPGNFIELAFLFTGEAEESERSQVREKSKQTWGVGAGQGVATLGRGAVAGRRVAKAPCSASLAPAGSRQLSPPLGAEDRGRDRQADLRPTVFWNPATGVAARGSWKRKEAKDLQAGGDPPQASLGPPRRAPNPD